MRKYLSKISDINIKLPTHLKVTITSWISIGISSLANFFAIKFILPYLGVDGYAVYVILFSFISWGMLTDFGIGQSLQNYISEFRVKKQDYQHYIDTTLQIIVIYAVVAVGILSLLCEPIQNFILSKYEVILSSQTINVVLTTLILFLTIAVTNVAVKVYYALQKGTVPNILTSAAYIISFCVMLCIVNIQNDSNKLLKIILCYTLPQIFLIGCLFFNIFKNSVKTIFKINTRIFKQLLSRSFLFCSIAIMVLLVNEIDYFVMAKTLNSGDIAVYSVFARIVRSVYVLYLCLLSAFWPMNAELYHSSKFDEIKKYLKKYLVFGICLMVFVLL
jgi:O-antigen/teichoic acid export membrane protein